MPRRNRHGNARGGRRGSARKQSRERERDDPAPAPVRPRGRRADDGAEPAVALVPLWQTPLDPSPTTQTCGVCREWFADEVGGRGSCDHPGSGFLKPWSDTPACPFFRAH